ncbi:MAG: hypothetical protein LIO95_05930 [Clostridiales bacterium]|nr:hypothetical protein [Clostridiales bacterium]
MNSTIYNGIFGSYILNMYRQMDHSCNRNAAMREVFASIDDYVEEA